MAPLDFPSNPVNGTTYNNYVWDSSVGAWLAQGSTNNVGDQIGLLNTYRYSPNYVINGAFDIWQRGTSIATTGSGNTNYIADRWRFGNNNAGSQYTASQVSNTSDAPAAYAIRITSARTDANLNGLEQVLEYRDVTQLRNKVSTFSFWVRASTSVSFTSSIKTGTLTNDIYPGPGNALTGEVTAASLAINATTLWQRISVTSSVIASNAGQLKISLIDNTSITNGVWIEFAGVQLESGPIATPFRRNANSIQGELAACQRYYQILGYGFAGYKLSATTIQGNIKFYTPLRVTPNSVTPINLNTSIFATPGTILYTHTNVVMQGASTEGVSVLITVPSTSAGTGLPVLAEGGGTWGSVSAEL